MLNTQQPHDVIIIGGGLAGLTTAVYLARAGRQVTILEKSTHLGGRATTQMTAISVARWKICWS